jgi:hypothetical protein
MRRKIHGDCAVSSPYPFFWRLFCAAAFALAASFFTVVSTNLSSMPTTMASKSSSPSPL